MASRRLRDGHLTYFIHSTLPEANSKVLSSRTYTRHSHWDGSDKMGSPFMTACVASLVRLGSKDTRGSYFSTHLAFRYTRYTTF